MTPAATLRTRFVETIVFEEGLVCCFDLTDPANGYHRVVSVDEIAGVIERLCIIGSAMGGEIKLPAVSQ
jgi:hypothetical protein